MVGPWCDGRRGGARKPNAWLTPYSPLDSSNPLKTRYARGNAWTQNGTGLANDFAAAHDLHMHAYDCSHGILVLPPGVWHDSALFRTNGRPARTWLVNDAAHQYFGLGFA